MQIVLYLIFVQKPTGG